MLTGWANAHPVVQIAHPVARFCPPSRKPKKWQNAPFALAAKKKNWAILMGFAKKKHTYRSIPGVNFMLTCIWILMRTSKINDQFWAASGRELYNTGMDRRSENAQIFQIYVFVTEIAHRNAKFFAASRRNFSTTWRETYVKTNQIKSKYYFL